MSVDGRGENFQPRCRHQRANLYIVRIILFSERARAKTTQENDDKIRREKSIVGGIWHKENAKRVYRMGSIHQASASTDTTDR